MEGSPTQELYDLINRNGPDANPSNVQRLLDAKANPFEGPHHFIYAAVYRQNCKIIQLIYAAHPDLDQDIPGCLSLLAYALGAQACFSTQLLLQLGFAYKHLQRLFFKSFHPDRDTFLFYRRGALLAALYTRFIAREESCQRACYSLLSAPIRALIGRDLARLLAGLVWRGHRGDEWEAPGAQEAWEAECRLCVE